MYSWDLERLKTGTKLRYKDDVMLINNNEIGEVSQKLYDTITGIQWGTIEDENKWTLMV